MSRSATAALGESGIQTKSSCQVKASSNVRASVGRAGRVQGRCALELRGARNGCFCAELLDQVGSDIRRLGPGTEAGIEADLTCELVVDAGSPEEQEDPV